MKSERQVLSVLYYDHHEIWLDITENNYRCIRLVFGLNMHSTIDSKSVDDIVNAMHLELVDKDCGFTFLSPYDKDPPLAKIIETGPKQELEKYRAVIVEKVSAFTNKVVRRKVIDLLRRNNRIVEFSDDDVICLGRRFSIIDGEALLNIVSDHQEVVRIITFLDESTKITRQEKSIFLKKLTGYSAEENSHIHRVSKDKINNTIRKVKKYIVRSLVLEGRI